MKKYVFFISLCFITLSFGQDRFDKALDRMILEEQNNPLNTNEEQRKVLLKQLRKDWDSGVITALQYRIQKQVLEMVAPRGVISQKEIIKQSEDEKKQIKLIENTQELRKKAEDLLDEQVSLQIETNNLNALLSAARERYKTLTAAAEKIKKDNQELHSKRKELQAEVDKLEQTADDLATINLLVTTGLFATVFTFIIALLNYYSRKPILKLEREKLQLEVNRLSGFSQEIAPFPKSKLSIFIKKQSDS